MISEYTHTLVAVKKEELSSLVNLAIEKGISIQLIDGENFESARNIISDIEYHSSDDTWQNSSC